MTLWKLKPYFSEILIDESDLSRKKELIRGTTIPKAEVTTDTSYEGVVVNTTEDNIIHFMTESGRDDIATINEILKCGEFEKLTRFLSMSVT